MVPGNREHVRWALIGQWSVFKAGGLQVPRVEGKFHKAWRIRARFLMIALEFLLHGCVYSRLSKAPVAQLDRASDYGSEGLRFKSSRVRHSATRSYVDFGLRVLLSGDK